MQELQEALRIDVDLHAHAPLRFWRRRQQVAQEGLHVGVLRPARQQSVTIAPPDQRDRRFRWSQQHNLVALGKIAAGRDAITGRGRQSMSGAR